jgi:hypothetical protein
MPALGYFFNAARKAAFRCGKTLLLDDVAACVHDAGLLLALVDIKSKDASHDISLQRGPRPNQAYPITPTGRKSFCR